MQPAQLTAIRHFRVQYSVPPQPSTNLELRELDLPRSGLLDAGEDEVHVLLLQVAVQQVVVLQLPCIRSPRSQRNYTRLTNDPRRTLKIFMNLALSSSLAAPAAAPAPKLQYLSNTARSCSTSSSTNAAIAFAFLGLCGITLKLRQATKQATSEADFEAQSERSIADAMACVFALFYVVWRVLTVDLVGS